MRRSVWIGFALPRSSGPPGNPSLRKAQPSLPNGLPNKQALLRRGWVDPMLQNLTGACIDIPKIGPGNKGRRERLGGVIEYLPGHRELLPLQEVRYHRKTTSQGVVSGRIGLSPP